MVQPAFDLLVPFSHWVTPAVLGLNVFIRPELVDAW
jgi:hypothetical protein